MSGRAGTILGHEEEPDGVENIYAYTVMPGAFKPRMIAPADGGSWLLTTRLIPKAGCAAAEPPHRGGIMRLLVGVPVPLALHVTQSEQKIDMLVGYGRAREGAVMCAQPSPNTAPGNRIELCSFGFAMALIHICCLLVLHGKKLQTLWLTGG
jgi:hypothetical protein